MPNTGFWSYVRNDDDAEQGRIAQLARDLVQQYEAITNDSIELFLDKISLGWGDDWESRIDSSIMSTVFFVPIITPRYLVSEACRREMQLFARKAEGLGANELILPLLWFDVPELAESDPTDDLVALIKRYHWEDWRELRFEERQSSAYRKAVAALAKRLADVNAQLNEAPPEVTPVDTLSSAAAVVPLDGDDDTPGTLDVLAAAMNALPEWQGTIEEVGEHIHAVSALAEDATAKMHEGDQRGKGLAVRLTVARQFGRDLEPHSARLEELSNDFTTHLYDVDAGVRALIAQAETEARDSDESLEAARAFFSSLRSMAESSRKGMTGLSLMVESMSSIEGMSRDMRAPLRRMRKALTVMVEGQTVIDDWLKLIDETQID